jgi:hypothetical protein
MMSSLYASSTKALEKEFKNMSFKQKQLLVKVFVIGKHFDLENTLTAIAWKESQAGLIPINVADPSCGVFHNMLSSVSRRHNNQYNTSYKRNWLCTKLITDLDFASSEAISELLYWKNYHKNNWNNIWGSYNAGFNYDSTVGKAYSKDILNRIKVIKKYIKGV